MKRACDAFHRGISAAPAGSYPRKVDGAGRRPAKAGQFSHMG